MVSKDYLEISRGLGLDVVRTCGRHHQLRAVNPVTRDWLTIPTSPSDHRSLDNFRSRARRLAKTGLGQIARCTTRGA